MKADLSMFEALRGQKIPWDKRYDLVRSVFSSIDQLDWSKTFKMDPPLAGAIINDIMKAGQEGPKRPGKRSSVNRDTASLQLKRLIGEDYSTESFSETLRALSNGRSIRNLAQKTGVERNRIYKLLHNQVEPDIYTMELVAQSFGKQPDFFLEYRMMYIMAALINRIESVPESTITHYRKIRKASETP